MLLDLIAADPGHEPVYYVVAFSGETSLRRVTVREYLHMLVQSGAVKRQGSKLYVARREGQ